MMFALSLLSQGINAQDINSKLLVREKCWGGCGMQQQGVKIQQSCLLVYFLREEKCPRNKPSVTRYRTYLGLAAECKSREQKFSNDVYSCIFQQSENCPRKKTSVGNYKICLGFAVECNSRELKFNNNVYLFSFYESEQFPRKKTISC